MLNDENNNKELIPKEFYQNSALRFKEELNKSAQRINQGSEMGNEITTLGNFCQNEFEDVRKEANGIFQKWVEKEKLKQEKEINNVIKEKDKEIEKLQTTINELLKGSPNIRENIKIYDNQRKDAERKIKKMKEETRTINIPEMLTRDQVNDTLATLHEELNEIKEEIQHNANNVSRDVEDVLKETQYMYKANIKSLVSSLKSQFHRNLNDIASQYNDKEKHLKEAYEAQKDVLNKMIDEIRKLNFDLEKKNQLGSRVSHVFIANSSLKPEKIMVRSFDINNILDINLKHNKVQDEYNKFVLFSELYGNKDLDIVATKNDLNAVKQYVDNTAIIPFTAVPPPQRPSVENVIMTFRPLFSKLYTVPHILEDWLNNMGENNYIKSINDNGGGGLFVFETNYDKIRHSVDAAIQRATSTYNNRLTAYQNSKKQHEDQIDKAQAAIFPSESFNRLVDQFNAFVNMI